MVFDLFNAFSGFWWGAPSASSVIKRMLNMKLRFKLEPEYHLWLSHSLDSEQLQILTFRDKECDSNSDKELQKSAKTSVGEAWFSCKLE